MTFTIPRKNASELLLYIWKIIDLPSISMKDLLYKISFELFIFPPEKANQFVNLAIKNKFLIIKSNNSLCLSQTLEKKLKNWQEERKQELLIQLRFQQKRNGLKVDLKKSLSPSFKILFNALSDRGTQNRAALISSEAFTFSSLDSDKGVIRAKVAGTEKDFYNIEIVLKDRTLRHNCQDFFKNRAKGKKFCKHIAKLFLILKEKNEDSTVKFLNDIAENINEWDFSS